MSLEIWLSFLLACAAIQVMPGPVVLLVASYALGGGRSTGWATIPGVTLGDFTAMTISLAGAGAVLATSATLFTALKIAGAVYLMWLGIKMWRSKPALDDVQNTKGSKSNFSMFCNAYFVTALNPKSIVFFVAFVPQFVDTTAPVVPQFVILEITFLITATIAVVIWAALAGSLRTRFKRAATLKSVNRIGGSFLIGAGLLTAAIRKTG